MQTHTHAYSENLRKTNIEPPHAAGMFKGCYIWQELFRRDIVEDDHVQSVIEINVFIVASDNPQISFNALDRSKAGGVIPSHKHSRAVLPCWFFHRSYIHSQLFCGGRFSFYVFGSYPADIDTSL